ncbi:MAG: 16S rRNA (guanine(966)-N(2))-methyltransferase RsmD [Bacteroidales bacterium]
MRIISGIYRRRRFDVPKNIKARPTTDFARENLFNVLNNIIDFEDMKALDLFAGTGAISFELLSRGAGRVVSVEKHGTQYDFIRKVAKELKDDNIVPIKGDVFKFIASSREKFDFIFADPPYDLPELEKIPELIFKAGLLKEDGLFILEHSKNNDFSDMPEFDELRTYGSVNFSFFTLKNTGEETAAEDTAETTENNIVE